MFRMIDKAKLIALEGIEPDKIHDVAKRISIDTSGMMDSHYLRARRYITQNKQVFTLKTNPKQQNIAPLAIELNPSHFSGLAEMNRVIQSITDLDKLRFSRLDFSSDLPVSFNDCWRLVDVKYKTVRDRYRSFSVNGLYFGCNNNIIKVYDKTKQANLDHPVTRVEVMQKHRSLVIGNFSKIYELEKFDPFQNIRFMELILPPESGSPKSYTELSERIKTDGLSVARRELGVQNNFNKTFSRYLTESPLTQQMKELHETELKKFLRS